MHVIITIKMGTIVTTVVIEGDRAMILQLLAKLDLLAASQGWTLE